jgi:hypothetical protein
METYRMYKHASMTWCFFFLHSDVKPAIAMLHNMWGSDLLTGDKKWD